MRLDLRSYLVLGVLTFLVAGCGDDGTAPQPIPTTETAIVLNSIGLSVTVFPADSPQNRRAIGLAPAGSPVTLAARGNRAVVPLGLVNAAAVVDLTSDDVSLITLPENSGATGIGFWDDSIAYIANPNRNTVSRVNISSRLAVSEIDVGVYPQAIIASAFWVFVLNAELDSNFQPARPGTISVLNPSTDALRETIALSGFNPAAAAFAPDGRLYVINSGTFGQGDGSLSIVDPVALTEVEHVTGFDEFPGDIIIDGSGRAFISSFSYGIAIWDTDEGAFLRPPTDPLVVAGHRISSGLALDSDQRVYTLIPGDCQAPGATFRLDPELSTEQEIGVGVCPIDIAFTELRAP